MTIADPQVRAMVEKIDSTPDRPEDTLAYYGSLPIIPVPEVSDPKVNALMQKIRTTPSRPEDFLSYYDSTANLYNELTPSQQRKADRYLAQSKNTPLEGDEKPYLFDVTPQWYMNLMERYFNWKIKRYEESRVKHFAKLEARRQKELEKSRS